MPPLSRSKLPATTDGFKSATTDPEQIRAWWRRSPDANVAVRTGAESGLVVLDVDIGHGGGGTLKRLEAERGKLPLTAEVLTGGGGRHYLFRHSGHEIRNSSGKLGPGLDVRGDGGYIVAVPSVHECGRAYRWMRPLEKGLAELPAWLLEDAAERRNGAAPKVAELIPVGKRNAELASLAGSMRARGMAASEIHAALRAVNERCRPPLPDDELERIAASVARYEPDVERAIRTVPDAAPRPIAAVLDVFRSWLHLPDPGAVLVTCATIAANRVEAFDPL